jgi:predicted secreted protein
VVGLTLTEAQNGGNFTVGVGDTIVVALAENDGGHHWLRSSIDERFLVVQSQQYERRSDAVGSAGTSVWRLRATGRGCTRLELKKARPWDPDGSIVARYSVTLEIAS